MAWVTAMRGLVKCCLGRPGWRDDADQAIAMARGVDPMAHVTAIMYKYVPIAIGGLVPGAAVLRETAEALEIAEHPIVPAGFVAL